VQQHEHAFNVISVFVLLFFIILNANVKEYGYHVKFNEYISLKVAFNNFYFIFAHRVVNIYSKYFFLSRTVEGIGPMKP
jgi:hypothetical protein